MRTLRVKLLVFVAFAAAAAGVGWWWYTITRPEVRLRAGQEALQQGDWERAEHLAAVLQAGGHPDHAHLLRGESLFRRREYTRALAEFNQITDQGEIRLQAAALSGQCLLYVDLRQAEAAFRFVIDQRPDNLVAHRGLADVYYSQGALMRAVHHLEEVGRLDPADGRAHRTMGLIYKDLGQYGPAGECYEEALRRTLSSADADRVRVEWATCLAKQRRPDRALEVLDHCDRATADTPAVLALRAECLWELGDVSRVRTLLDGAQASHPRAAALLCLRGKLYLADNEAAKAVPLLERAVEADPHDLVSRRQLALAYRRVGRAEAAAEQERRAREIERDLDTLTRLNTEAMAHPWDAAVRRRLAEVCWKLNKPKEAEMWLQAAAACSTGP
jgi:tetratricopeptide (TPR) repeat protein